MSPSTSTAAQRAELVAACNMLAKYLNVYTEDYSLATANTALITKHQTYLTRVQAALTAIANQA